MNIIKHNWNWSHGLSARSATDAIIENKHLSTAWVEPEVTGE